MNKKGFTLLELLVVVLIIGILAAVAMPQYRRAVMKSQFATLKIMAQALAHAEEVHYLAEGKYADDIDTLSVGIPSDHDNGRTFYFDWGYCLLTINIPYAADRVGCDNEKIGLSYTVFLENNTNASDRGARCIVMPSATGQTAHKICQQETGTTIPCVEEYGWSSYCYQ